MPVDHPDKPKFEYNQIDDYIYIGTNMCCQSHFEEELLEQGILGDISLEKERIDAAHGVDYYIWIPVKDKTPPSMSQLDFGVEIIAHFVKTDQKVYVHCKNGHGRAPTMVVAYYIKSKGMTTDQAVEFIREKRPSVHLEPSQMERLNEYHESLSS